MKRKILLVDTETGGLDPSQHSIISFGVVIWEDGRVVDSLHVTVKEQDGVYTADAIKINQYTKDRIEAGDDPVTAVTHLMNFCSKHGIRWAAEIGGHNTQFDAGFLQRLFRLAGKKYPFSHRMVCTQSAAILLRLAGKLDVKATSLDALCAHYNIPIRMEGAPHDALEDVIATAHLLTALLKEIGWVPPEEKEK